MSLDLESESGCAGKVYAIPSHLVGRNQVLRRLMADLPLATAPAGTLEKGSMWRK
jgi:hypothetical protein